MFTLGEYALIIAQANFVPAYEGMRLLSMRLSFPAACCFCSYCMM